MGNILKAMFAPDAPLPVGAVEDVDTVELYDTLPFGETGVRDVIGGDTTDASALATFGHNDVGRDGASEADALLVDAVASSPNTAAPAPNTVEVSKRLLDILGLCDVKDEATLRALLSLPDDEFLQRMRTAYSAKFQAKQVMMDLALMQQQRQARG